MRPSPPALRHNRRAQHLTICVARKGRIEVREGKPVIYDVPERQRRAVAGDEIERLDQVSRTPPDFNSFWLKEMEANNFEGHPIVPKLNQIIREANTAINRAYAGGVGARQAIEEAMPKLTSFLG